jgi:hypothetical protein
MQNRLKAGLQRGSGGDAHRLAFGTKRTGCLAIIFVAIDTAGLSQLDFNCRFD